MNLIDYKFVILLVILLGLIFLIVKEMGSVKEEINNIDEKLKKSFTAFDHKIQMGFNTCVDKIRIINGQYMVQIRKMSDMEGQTIMSATPNGYTDSDSIKKSHPAELGHLTDEAKNKLEKSKGKNTDQEKNKFVINYENEKTLSATDKNSKKNNLLSHELPNKENVQQNAINNSVENYSCRSDDDKVQKYDSTSTSDESDEESDNSDDISTGILIEVKSELLNDAEKKLSEKISSVSSKHSEKISSVSSKHSEKNVITVSSSKNKETNENKEVKKDIDDDESIVTMDVALTITTLKPVEQYTRTYLEKVAKQHSIPITIKDGIQSRRVLKKEELYDRIKEKLNNK